MNAANCGVTDAPDQIFVLPTPPLIERIEARAFGCMADELAQRASLEGTGPILSASIAAKLTKLTKLIEQCMRPDVAARPSFAAIVATLADI